MAEQVRREFKFYPVEYFEWYRIERDEVTGEEVHRELIGAYHPGMSYNCTKQAVHNALFAKCQQWEKQGKIKIRYLRPDEKFVMVNPQEKPEDGNTTEHRRPQRQTRRDRNDDRN